MINERSITLGNSNEKPILDQNADIESMDVPTVSNYDKSSVTEKEDQFSENKIDDTLSAAAEEESQHDGGYGWLVVFGAFLVQITSMGTCTSVMQDYYAQNMFADVPNAVLNLSFVGTISLIFMNASSIFVQISVSMFGVRSVLIAGTLLIGIGLEMASLATQIWHLYLTQGVLFGCGASCMYVSVMAVAPKWFTKKRGLALGFIASGSGIGGLIIPFIMAPVNAKLGPGWTYRILGFVCLFCDIVACVVVKERIPTAKTRKRLHQIVDFSVYADTNFLLFSISSNIGLFGYFIPYFFLPANATYLGLSPSQGSTLIAVSSACNFIGRIITGFLADRIGKINTNFIFTIITALSCLLIWTFANTYASLMGFSLVFGLTSGSFFALLSPISLSLLGPEKFMSGLSLLLLSNVVPVFGPNIASAIEDGVHAQPFFSYKMFSGVAYIVAAVLLGILKLRLDRNIFAKV